MKFYFVSDILEVPSVHTPVFCIQEHFLLQNNIYKLSKVFGLGPYTGWSLLHEPKMIVNISLVLDY